MPRGDRTGPRGMGPMTGRGMGFCAGYDAPGYANPGAGGFGRGGMGMGFGGGRGRGMGRGMAWGRGGGRWYAPPAGYGTQYPQSPEQEKAFIEAQLKGIRMEMEAMEKRLSELSAEEKK